MNQWLCFINFKTTLCNFNLITLFHQNVIEYPLINSLEIITAFRQESTDLTTIH